MLGNAFDRRQHFVRCIAHQFERLVEIAVRVNVDGHYPLAPHLYGQARGLRLGARRVSDRATAKRDAARGSLQEVSTRAYSVPHLIARLSFERPVKGPPVLDFLA